MTSTISRKIKRNWRQEGIKRHRGPCGRVPPLGCGQFWPGRFVSIFFEIGIFRIRPDVWVVNVQGASVGVVVVKKPDALGQTPALNYPNVLGELKEFTVRFFGITLVFGLLTTFVAWRVAWCPKDDCDAVAARESYNGPEDFTSS